MTALDRDDPDLEEVLHSPLFEHSKFSWERLQSKKINIFEDLKVCPEKQLPWNGPAAAGSVFSNGEVQFSISISYIFLART